MRPAMELLTFAFAMRDLQEGWGLSPEGIPRCIGLPLDRRIARPQQPWP
jgi:hypothetical protein